MIFTKTYSSFTPERIHKGFSFCHNNCRNQRELLGFGQGLLILCFHLQLQSSPPTFGIERSLRAERESTSRFTEYCTSGDIIGELCCLLKREFEYTAICETILQVRNWFYLYCGLLVNYSSKRASVFSSSGF